MGVRIPDLNTYFIIILNIFLSAFLFAQPENIRFEHLTAQDGLSDNRVQCIIQDSRGFMWFGTMNGLNKFDGYKFTIYRNDPDDSSSLADNFISRLFEDHSGELWIGTFRGGLCKYDRDNDSFTRYAYDQGNQNSLCGNLIQSIFETDEHVLWIGTNNGLNKYNRETDDFGRYYPDQKTSQIEANANNIGTITQDTHGQLWIGTHNEGLFYYDVKNDKFIRYKPHPEYSKTFINKFAYDLVASQLNGNNCLWFTGLQNGLFRINLETDEIKHYKHETDNPNSMPDNRISAIYQSRWESQELWIGTESGLVDRFDIRSGKFTHFRYQSENSDSGNYDPVLSILRDRSGLVWVGTLQGIYKSDPAPAKFRTMRQDAGNPQGLSGYFVWAIYESTIGGNRSVLWLGTDNGLYMFDRTSGRFTGYQYDPQNRNSLSHNVILSIVETQFKNRKILWASTGDGLNKIDLSAGRIIRYHIPTNDPFYNEIYTLCGDKNGKIWIGTRSPYLYSFDPQSEQFTKHGRFGVIRILKMDAAGKLWIGTESNGLFEFNPATKKDRHYHHIAGNVESISNNTVLSILEDKNGRLWIGTDGGLNKFVHSTRTFTSFGERDGLISNLVRAILADKRGNLWISTDKGISKFNPNNKEFRNFTVTDGLHHNEFWWGAHISHRGEMFFGGRNGLTYFHPDSITDNSYIPPIVLTDFQMFNKTVKPGQNSPLKKQLSEVSEITLSHDQSIFSFEFAALEYRKPEKIKYKYMMENVDPDWVFTDASRRFVTYTQLNAGEYIFRVKASNADGIWNEQGTSVKITILPPWWKTGWAYFIYVCLILGTLYGLRRYELNRQRLKHNLELEKVEADKLVELDKMKSRFFANISHEFRTPLTLIKGPIERWLPKMEQSEMRQDFEITRRNTNRLLRLVNQLLDISRLESGKMKLQARPENIVELTRQLSMAFESLAGVNEIDLRFEGPEDPITVYLDREHYEKIIINLLFNALKFTPAGGQVIVHIPPIPPASPAGRPSKGGIEGGTLEIRITDTGAGIPADHLPHIFDRFYQAGDTYAKDVQGTGIGLALTKELVELHHGEISVQSAVGKATEFSIRFPLGKDHLKAEEIVDIPLSPSASPVGMPSKEDLSVPPYDEPFSIDQGRQGENYVENIEQPSSKDAPILLIVEDNPDMRTHIREMLVESYKIIEAADGQKGFEKAAKIIPDIIISDVMMPEMDGFQFCERIKGDVRTSHIPVILLTAKSSGESKIEGLETGADDYLTKPFDSSELKVRVNNLIEQRRKLRERFRREITLEPQKVAITSADARFLERAIDSVEQNIEETEFGVSELSNRAGMSRSQLFRKIKALTDQTPNEFIRTIKMKRAATLLEHHAGNISEVAYQVGFNNPAYFAECFRKIFGVSPKEYASQFKN